MLNTYGVDTVVDTPGNNMTIGMQMFAWDGGGVVCGVKLSGSSYMPFCIVEDINNPYHQAMTQKLPVAYTEGLWLEMKVRKVAQSFVVNIYVNTFLVGTATLPERLIKNTASTDSSVIVWDGNVYIAAVYQYFEDAGVAAFNPRIKYLADVEKITPVTRRELWRTG